MKLFRRSSLRLKTDFMGIKVWEYYLSTKAVRRQYPPFIRQNIFWHRQLSDNKKNLDYIYSKNSVNLV